MKLLIDECLHTSLVELRLRESPCGDRACATAFRCILRIPGVQKAIDYPTDIMATKNIVTNSASTSMNMVVTPSNTLDLRV